MMCKKCSMISGVLLLVLGIIYLLGDLAIWDFWGISWYTTVFVLIGVIKLASSHCSDCNACCTMPAKKK